MTAPPFDLSAFARDVAELAARNLYLGTSSWKYAGWTGQLYEEQRYLWRGKFSESRFDKHCLGEYFRPLARAVVGDDAFERGDPMRREPWLRAF